MEPNTIIVKSYIKDLVIRERYYRDTCQWDKLRGCYHPDNRETKIDISWYHGDVDGFIDGSKAMASQGSHALHTITPVEIEIEGKRAVSTSVGSITARFSIGENEFELISTCRFVSRLKDIDNTDQVNWKMLTMECIYVHDAVTPIVPSEIRDNVSLQDSTRKSYRYLSLLLKQKGRTVNNHLAGIDDPQSVQSILERNNNWLLSRN